MSKNFTPEPTVNGCTQSHGSVFCCQHTTSVEKNKSVAYERGAVRKPAPFVLRKLESRKKRYAPGNESATNQSGRIEGAAITLHDSPFTIATSSSIYFNTVSFMKILLRKPGMLAMLFMIVSLFVVSNTQGQITLAGGSIANAVQSNTASGTSVTINRPTSLAVGDIMLANIVQHDDSGGDDLTAGVTSSGWTPILNAEFSTSTDPEYRGTLLYKIAVLADVTASNYAFSGNTSVTSTIGAIVAFRGVDNTTPFDVAPGTTMTTGSADDLSAASITTVTANAAVIMFGMVGDNRSIDEWVTATSPGSLGELYDVPSSTGDDSEIGAAWAIKSSPGATGAGDAELNDSDNDFFAAKLIALRPCTPPTISTTGIAAPVCFSTSAQSTTLAYTATTGSPVSYGIDWTTPGIVDQGTTVISFSGGAGTITGINIPASTAPNTYNGILIITNATNCSSSTQAISVTVNPSPTITTAGTVAPVCFNALAQTTSLVYSATTQSPNSYTIDWNAAANTAGLADQGSTAFAFTPGAGTVNNINVTAGTPVGSYSGTMTITNAGGCTGTQAVTISVLADGTWIGVTSTDWFSASNWCGGVPTSATNVVIPSGTPFAPTIGAPGLAVCNNITINSGAILTITGTNDLTVSGNWLNSGTLVPNNSTMVFNAAVTQTVNNGGTGDFYNVTHSGAGTLQVLTNQFVTTNSFNNSGGTFDLNGVNGANAPSLGDLQGSGGITNNVANTVILTVGTNGANTSFSGIISNGATPGTMIVALTKSGPGTLALSGTNTYSGTTTVSAGALAIENNSAFGTGVVTFNGGTIMASAGPRTILNDVSIGSNNGTIGGADDLTINGAWTQTASSQLTISNSANTIIGGNISLTTTATPRTLTITGTGNVTLGGVIQNGGAGAGSVTFSGTYSGTATINGTNTYSGATTLSAGTFVLGNPAAFGTSSIAINGVSISASTDLSGANAIANAINTLGDNNIFTGTNNIEFSGSITQTGSRTVTNNISGGILKFSGPVNLSNGSSDFTLSINGSGNTTISGVIANGGTSTASNLTYSGSGILTLTNSANTYAGTTTISSGEVRINPASTSATFASQVVLNGGELGTTSIGANTNFVNSSTLDLDASSTIDLDLVAVHSIHFAPSNLVTWNGSAILTVDNWQGVAGSPGTAGRIFIGSTIGTLTATQLAQIQFTGFPGVPIILAGTGELVPQPSTPLLVITGTTNHGTTCIGSSTSAITYTITNIGGSPANNVVVTSGNQTEFAYPGDLSLTTIGNIAPNNTATFTITFTPNGAGNRTSLLTATNDSGDPSTYGSLSIDGTGVAAPTATIPFSVGTGSATICVNGTYTLLPNEAATSNGTFAWTENGAGSITAGGTTLEPTYTPAAGDAGNTVTLTLTVSNAFCTSASDTYSILVNPTPALFNVTPGTSPICTGSSSTVDLSGSVSGVSYQLRNGVTPIGSAVPGDGNPLSFPTGPLTSTTTFNILATDGNICSIQMSGTATITVILAVPTVSFSPGATSVTTGTIIDFTDLSTNSPSSWSWTFAGGTPGSSTLQNPSVTYNTTAGSPFSVSLTATNVCGPNTATLNNHITVTALTNPVTYTNVGPHSFVVPPGVTCIKVEAWGGGGGGSSVTGIVYGGGGGGGAYARSSINVSPSSPHSIIVGNGGGANTTGGSSSFDAIVIALPGNGASNNSTNAGSGGSGASSTGSQKFSGGNGANGQTLNISGGGGGGAGSGGPGGNASGGTAGTGTAVGGGSGGAGIAANNPGAAGNSFGGGGSGAARFSGGAQAGGSGANGAIRVTWLDASNLTTTSTSPICQPNNGSINISSTSLADDTYEVNYTLSGANSVPSANATVTLVGGSGTLTIPGGSLTNAGLTTVVINSFAFVGSGCPQPAAANSTSFTVNPPAPAAVGTISGISAVCSGVTTLTYSVAAVTNATNYTWTVPTGWNITSGQGTTSITVTSGAAGQNGNITVVASNACGSSPNITSNVTIQPDNSTNTTGFTTNGTPITLTDGNINVHTQNAPIRRGFIKFPLSAIPTGATIVSSTLTINSIGTDGQSGNANTITALGNNDPVAATNQTAINNLYAAIQSGATYNSSIWTQPGISTLTLNAAAIADIQSRFASPGYLAVGLLRGTGSSVYIFSGRSAGVNAPALAVTYTAPRQLAVTVAASPVVGIVGGVTQLCTIAPNNTAQLTPTSAGTWISNNTGAATVTSPGGLVTAVAGLGGTTNFTFTSSTAPFCSASTGAITVVPAPTLTLGSDYPDGGSVCSSETIFLYTGTDGLAINHWTIDGGTGSIVPHPDFADTYIFTPTLGTTPVSYAITFTTVNAGVCGQVTSPEYNITVSPAATVQIVLPSTPTATICSNEVLNLTATANAVAGQVSWSYTAVPAEVTGDFDDENSLTPTFTPNGAGTFTITVTTEDPDDAGPCGAATDVITVTVNPAPPVPTFTAVVAGPVCPNTFLIDQYSHTLSGPDTYTWIVTGNYAFVGGETDNPLSIQAGTLPVPVDNNPSNGSDPEPTDITIILSASNSFGCTSLSLPTILVVEDNAPSVTGSITATTVEGCEEGDAPAAVTTVAELEALGLTISDVCTEDALLVVTYDDESTGTCPLVVTRTYTITDAVGNFATATHIINVDDQTAPSVTGSITATTVEGCEEGDAPAAVTTVAGLEALGLAIIDVCTADIDLTVTHTDATSGTCPIVITRTYTITDACGNFSTATHIINVDDQTAPSVTGSITATTVEGCEEGDAPAAVTTVAGLEALGLGIIDVCTADIDLTVTHSDATTGTCPIVITRTYTITDACGNFSTATHIINVDDQTAPSVTGSITATTVEGCEEGDAPAAVTTVAGLEALGLGIIDVCTADIDLTVTHTDAATGTCPIVITRTYTITDACGNFSTATHIINVDDQTAPSVTGSITATTVEGCEEGDAPAAVTTVAGLEALGLGIIDVCTADIDLTVTHSDATSGTCPIVITRTYTITDACGNFSTATHIINVDDQTAPSVTGSITATTVEGCEEGDAPAAVTTVAGLEALGLAIIDVCTADIDLTVTHSDAATGTCPIVITRTYTITDACGNFSTATHIINVDDQTAPSVTGSITATTAEGCEEGDVPAAVTTVAGLEALGLTISDVCTADIDLTVTHSDATTGTCPIVITRTYTITDACGNFSTATHIINVDDQTAPSVTGSITATTVEGCEEGDAPAAVTTVAGLEALGLTISDVCTEDALLVVTYDDESTGTCPLVVTRTYTITDACGNFSTATHIINVDDQTAPSVTGSITATTVEGCEEGDVPAAVTTVAGLEALGLTISDVCTADIDLTVTHSDATTGTCPIVITRTYTITDACGNFSTATHIINVDDQTAPSVTGSITATTVEGCEEGDAPAAVTTVAGLEALGLAIIDVCTADIDLTVTHTDATSGTCPIVITRTYTITDACGNFSTATHIINVDDQTAPSVTGSITATTVEGCEEGDAPAAVTTVAGLEALGLGIIDVCTADIDLTVTHSDATTGTCPIVITRTYTITDACGNFSTATHIINVDDQTAPSVTGSITATTVEGCEEGDAPAAVTTVAGLEALGLGIIDVCTADIDLTVTHTDAATGTCPIVITRTYTITDACGNFSTATHIINVDDQTAPSVTGSITATTVEGCEEGDAPAAVTTVAGLEALGLAIIDVCTADIDLTVTHSDAATGTCPIVITRTYTITDACGNFSTATHIINVDDQTAPSVTGSITATTVEGCEEGDAPAAVTTVAGLEALGLAIIDVCTADIDLTVTHSDAATGTCPIVITRTYTITDACGNFSTATHIINVDDQTAPSVTGSITATTVEGCEEGDAPAAVTTVAGLEALGLAIIDVCTADIDLTVTHSDATTGTCPIVITRTYTITDACGNFSTATHIINVDDQTPPTFTTTPGFLNRTVDCNDAAALALAQLLQPVAVDACGGTITYVKTPGSFVPGSCGGSYTNTWTATDACGNTTPVAFTQVITVTDMVQPTASDPAASFYQCLSQVPSPNVNVVTDEADNCGTPTVALFSVSITGAGSPASPLYIFRTYSVTDGCTPPIYVTHTITVIDNTPPTISNMPLSITRNVAPNSCVALVTWTHPTATDNCGSVTIVPDNPDYSSPIAILSIGTHTIAYTATDAAGNQSFGNFTITVVDNQNPTITCPANIVVNNTPGQCSAVVTYTASASDNCGAPTVSFSPASGSTFTVGTHTVTATATDAAGRTATCTFTVTVNDNQAPVPVNSSLPTVTATCSVTVPAPLAIDNCSGLITATPASLTFNTPGSYLATWTYTDGNGNSSSQTQLVVVNGDVVSINSHPANATACAGEDVLLSINATGSLQWQVNTGSGFVDINLATTSMLSLNDVTAAMNGYQYRVRVSGTCSTIYSQIATLTVNPAPNAPTVGAPTQPDCTVATGSVTLSGLPAGLWVINPGNIPGNTATHTISGLTPGIHTFTVTNAAGCISPASLPVQINTAPTPPAAPTIVAGSIVQPTCSVPTGSVTLSGLPAGLWEINPGSIVGNTSTKNITGLVPGIYTFTVTNGLGCISAASLPVQINAAPGSPAPPTVGTITQPNCTVGTGSVVLNGLPAGLWVINPGNIPGNTSSTTISGLAPGTHTFTVTNGLGCSSAPSGPVVIDPVPTPPSAPLVGTITHPTCTVGTGSVILNGLPAGLWTINPGNLPGNSSSTTISNLAPGTHTFTVTTAAGCTSLASGNVVINDVPATPSAPLVGTIIHPTCTVGTGSVILNGLPAGLWTINPGNIPGNTSSTTISGLAPGTHTFTVTNAAGCISVASGPVVIDPAPATPAAPTVGTITQPTCTVGTGSVILNGLPAGFWVINPGNIPGNTSSTTISGLVPGTHTFTVTNAAGCISVASGPVLIDPAPAVPSAPAVGLIVHPTCTVGTGSVTLNGLPAGLWTINPGNIPGNTSSTTISGLAPGTHTFTVTTAAGCVSLASAPVVIDPAPATPAAPTVGTIIQPTCTVGTGSVILSGLPAGIWVINPGNIPGNTSSTTISGLAPGTHTFTVTNAAGCISAASGPVVIDPAPSLPAAPTVGTITQPSCTVATGSVALSGLPAGLWTINPGNIPGNTSSTTISGLAPGTHTFTVTNAAGCTSLASGPVQINAAPGAPAAPTVGTITHPTCTVTTGSVNLSGLPAGLWTLNPGNIPGNTSSTTVSGLAPGTYQFTVTTAAGCTSGSSTVVINNQPVVPAPTVGTIVHPTCTVATGSVTLSGLPAGLWTINPGNISGSSSSTTISGLVPGTHTFTVTSAAGCTSVPTSSILINLQPVTPGAPTVGAIVQPTCTVSTGSVTLGGLPGGSWTINPGNISGSGSGTTISGLAAGTYMFTVTNAAGCTSSPSNSAVINAQPPTPTLYAVSGGGGYCSGAGYVINLSGSQAGVGYQLKRGSMNVGSAITGTGSPLNFPAQTLTGTYTVVATISGGCSATMNGSAIISAGTLPNLYTVTVTGTGYTCNSTVLLSGSQLGVTYQLKRGGTTNVGSPVAGTGNPINFGPQTVAGYYSVLATAQFGGCTRTMTGSPAVTSAHPPTAQNVIGGGAACSAPGVSVGLAGSQSGVSYQLRRNGSPVGSPVTGTGASISFGLQAPPSSGTDVYTVFATNPTTGCTNTMNGQATISRSSYPIVYTVSGGGTYCPGGTPRLVNLSNSQKGVNYRLYRNGVATGAVITGALGGGPISFTGLTIAGTYTIVADFLPITGCAVNMSGSATISCVATKPAQEQIITKGLKTTLNIAITAYPNPSENHFNVKVTSPVKETVELRMFDMAGKMVEMKRGAPDQVFRFGGGSAAGMYIIEARQAGIADKATIKVVKVN